MVDYNEIKDDFIIQLEQKTLVINKERIDDKLLVDDLYLTQTDIFDIVVSLEDIFDVDTSETDLESLKTVRDIIEMFEREINKENE
jgi:acyl carrier protein